MGTTTRVLRLTTPYGKVYYIHNNGAIERGDQPGQPSGGWFFLGLALTRASNYRAIRFPDLVTQVREGTLPQLLYKNGNPRYTVIDWDHGTKRVWGNTQHHGVRSLSLVDA